MSAQASTEYSLSGLGGEVTWIALRQKLRATTAARRGEDGGGARSAS